MFLEADTLPSSISFVWRSTGGTVREPCGSKQTLVPGVPQRAGGLFISVPRLLKTNCMTLNKYLLIYCSIITVLSSFLVLSRGSAEVLWEGPRPGQAHGGNHCDDHSTPQKPIKAAFCFLKPPLVQPNYLSLSSFIFSAVSPSQQL